MYLPFSLLSIARQNDGMVTTDDLLKAGVSNGQRHRLLKTGLLVPTHRGVYRVGTQSITFSQRCRSAMFAAPEAVLSGQTAGRVYGLRKCWTNDIHILGTKTIDIDGVISHKTDLLREHDIAEVGGLRVLAADRLFCDLAVVLSDADLESVLEQVLHERLSTIGRLRTMARRFRRPGRPGSRRVSRVLEARDEWLRPSESDLELRLWRKLAELGVQMERQHEIRMPSGQPIRVDLADPERRIAIEVDHIAFHGGRLDVERDKRRDRGAAAVGWSVVRVTDADIAERLHQTASELLQALRPAA